MGVEVVCTVGSAHKIATIVSKTGLAEERIIVRNQPSFRKQLRSTLNAIKADHEGFDVIMESLGGSYLTDCYEEMARNGRLGLRLTLSDFIMQKN